MAASTDELIAKLRDTVQCPICLEQYEDPRSLPCQHGFCTKCLEGMLGRRQRIKCPCCNKEAPVPNGVRELPVDFRANTQLEILSGYQRARAAVGDEPVLAELGASAAPQTRPLPNTRRGTSSVGLQLAQNAHQEGQLTFHPWCGKDVVVHPNKITARNKNPMVNIVESIVLTSRYLKPNELFEVRLNKKGNKCGGSMAIGVTTYSPTASDFPQYHGYLDSGTWFMEDRTVWNRERTALTSIKDYKWDLNDLKVGERVGVQRTLDGDLHFYINGVDLGVATSNVPADVYGYIDLCGKVEQVTIIDTSETHPFEAMCLLS